MVPSSTDATRRWIGGQRVGCPVKANPRDAAVGEHQVEQIKTVLELLTQGKSPAEVARVW